MGGVEATVATRLEVLFLLFYRDLVNFPEPMKTTMKTDGHGLRLPGLPHPSQQPRPNPRASDSSDLRCDYQTALHIYLPRRSELWYAGVAALTSAGRALIPPSCFPRRRLIKSD